MNQMLSLSTGSEFLRPGHVIFVVRFLVSFLFFDMLRKRRQELRV